MVVRAAAATQVPQVKAGEGREPQDPHYKDTTAAGRTPMGRTSGLVAVAVALVASVLLQRPVLEEPAALTFIHPLVAQMLSMPVVAVGQERPHMAVVAEAEEERAATRRELVRPIPVEVEAVDTAWRAAQAAPASSS